MRHGTRLLTAGFALILALGLAPGTACADNISLGAGPDVQAEFFPNNPLVMYESKITISTSTPDTVQGYEICFATPAGDPGTPPEGVYGSFVRGSEQHYLEYVGPEGSTRWPQAVFLRPEPAAPLPTAPDPYQESNIDVEGVLVDPGPVGIAINLDLRLRYRTPQIPATSWTLTNTAAHAITDAHIKFTTDHPRYLVLPDVPAGDSITVEGQMDPEWEWTFGGMLASPTPEPVIAFGPGGESPEGRDFTEVFTNAPYGDPDSPTCGLGAAKLADRERNGWDTPDLGRIGTGRPEGAYQCEFEPSQVVPRTFQLYSFSTGTVVGEGEEAPLLSPLAWDPAGTPASPSGGSGTWDTTANEWAEEGADHVWVNAQEDHALFGGAPGEVQIDQPITAGSLAFDTGGYVLTGAGPLTLTTGGLCVGEGLTATIQTPIAGTELLKGDQGTAVLNADNTYTGPTRILGGTLAVSDDANLGDTASLADVAVEQGACLRATSGFTTQRRFCIGDGGGTIRVDAGTLLIASEDDSGQGLAGTGDLVKTGPGELCIAAPADSERDGTGLLVEQGTLSTLAGIGYYVDLTIAAGGTFKCLAGLNILDDLTINGGTVAMPGPGEPNEARGSELRYNDLFMKGGTVYIGQNDCLLSDGALVAAFAADTTARVQPIADDYSRVSFADGTFDIADGSPAVDMEIQLGCLLEEWSKYGEGTLRFSGTKPNENRGTRETGCVHAGIVELAKPDGTRNCDLLEIAGGEVRLVHGNQVTDDASLTLSGGVFNLNDCAETLGTLILTDDSTLLLGDASSAVAVFAESHGTSWDAAAILDVLQWSGNLAGGGTEGLFFGTDASGLTADQLACIEFRDPAGLPPGAYDARILDTGEVVPVPEPASLTLLAAGGLGLALRRRRP